MPIDDFPTTTTALPRLRDCTDHAHDALRAARQAAHHLEGARATRVAELVGQLAAAVALRQRARREAQRVKISLYRSLDAPRLRPRRGRAVIGLYGFDHYQHRRLRLDATPPGSNAR